MKISAFLTAAGFAALCVSGCTSFTYDGETPGSDGGRVIVFSATQAPNTSMWRKIGSAVMERNARLAPEEILINQMREEAADVGADAIHITQCSIVGREDGGEGWLDTRRLCADFYVHIPIQDDREAEAPAQASEAEAPAQAAEADQSRSETPEQ